MLTTRAPAAFASARQTRVDGVERADHPAAAVQVGDQRRRAAPSGRRRAHETRRPPPARARRAPQRPARPGRSARRSRPRARHAPPRPGPRAPAGPASRSSCPGSPGSRDAAWSAQRAVRLGRGRLGGRALVGVVELRAGRRRRPGRRAAGRRCPASTPRAARAARRARRRAPASSARLRASLGSKSEVVELPRAHRAVAQPCGEQQVLASGCRRCSAAPGGRGRRSGGCTSSARCGRPAAARRRRGRSPRRRSRRAPRRPRRARAAAASRPGAQSGRSIPASSQIVGKMSMWDTIASDTLPPGKPPGPRMISMTPMPRSYSVALAPGKARPWSVVQITSVLSASPSSSSASAPCRRPGRASARWR